MPDVVIYHNPRCGTSRKALELIQRKGIRPRVVEYLKTPPSEKEMEGILRRLGMEPRELIRTKEKEYKKLNLDHPGLSRADLIVAMIKHPILIQRPIVVSNDRAVLGRPPENVEKIL